MGGRDQQGALSGRQVGPTDDPVGGGGPVAGTHSQHHADTAGQLSNRSHSLSQSAARKGTNSQLLMQSCHLLAENPPNGQCFQINNKKR